MERVIRPIAGSLNALLVLEVVVRHSSLSRAAEELGLSQPAVSRHIATLEERLGQALFKRNNNQISPLSGAVQLANAVALGFGHLDHAWTEISAPPDRHEVTLACTYGFADQWMMPRFAALTQFLGGARVRVVTTDQLGDIDHSRLDAAVVWDATRLPERPSFPLIKSEVFPICSPEFLTSYPAAADRIQDVPPHMFLHFDVGESGFMTWQKWFALAQKSSPAFTYSNNFDAYPFLLQSVLKGRGIGLGWRGLVDQALESGQILRLGPTQSDREVSYYLQHRPVRNSNGLLAKMLLWFREAAEI
jgi:DNA-binding transcriptional LysR family regulator